MPKKYYKGILEILEDGYGFLRNPANNFMPSPQDIYVAQSIIDKLKLREGLLLECTADKRNGNKSRALSKIVKINDEPFEKYADVKMMKERVSIDPDEKLNMTLHGRDLTGRAIDLLVPIGRGQRGMIISPPKAGKTTILKHVAKAVLKNHPDVEVEVLLVDERPEEVTDFKRDLPGAQVYASSADQSVENHLRVVNLSISMAMRKAEYGKDVFLVIDSLTRMGRAYNVEEYSGGKTLTGGLGATALELPRRFFGAARNIEDGGSLTIIATILVQTGSRMDDIIYQEFKGTGNMDLMLSRECAEQRLFPAVNIKESGTRKENKLLDDNLLMDSYYLRRKTAEMRVTDALEHTLKYLKKNR